MKPDITMISFDVTTKCNLNCNHCRTERLGEELSTGQVFVIIDEVAKLKPQFIALTGGEPFTRKDLREIVGRVKNHNICVQINTNSLLVEEPFLKELCTTYGIDYIQVSLDGLKDIHEQYRHQGNFEKTIEKMKMISRYTKLIINTTVSRLNIDNLYSMGEFLFDEQQINCYVWGFKRLVPTNDFGKEHYLRKEDLAKLTAIWNELAQKYKGKVQVKTDIPQKNVLIKDKVKAIMEKHNLCLAGCAAANSSLTVKANGDVAPCTIIPMSVGNLFKQSAEEILATPLMQNLIKRENLEGKCGSCENIIICGGCRATAYALTGNILGEDGACYI